MPICESIIITSISVFLLAISEILPMSSRTKYNGLLHMIIDVITKEKETPEEEQLLS
jgi:hypothetical protein